MRPFVLALASGTALAHSEPVRVLMIFPTAARAGLQVQVVGDQSGFKIAGALLELTVSTGGSSRTVRLAETGPGEYKLDQPFAPGNYVFTLTDRTYPEEALTRRVEAPLPRPADQDTYSWSWPATRGAGAASTPARSLPLALVGVLVVPLLAGVALVWQVRRRGSPPPSP